MDINQLKQFCLIVETGTMAEASRLLKLSAGVLSRSMQRLSDDVGFDLFRPDGRRLIPSEQGQKFFPIAKQALNIVNTGMKVIRENKSIEKPIRIASFEVFTTHFITEVIKEDFSGEEFIVLEKTPGHLEQSILNNEVDFGITYAPVTHQNLVFLKITSFNMAIFAREGSFRDLDFSNIPFAVPTTSVESNLAGIDSLDGWSHSAAKRFIKYRFEMLETAILMCRKGMCAVYIPEFTAALANSVSDRSQKLVRLPMPKNIGKAKLDVFLVMRKSMAEGRDAKRLAKGLRKLCSAVSE